MTRSNPIGELIEMHKYARPASSTYETMFSARFIKPLKGVAQDTYGNWIGQIGDNPKVLWSSHTDTVHTVPGFQALAVLADLKPEQDQVLFLSRKETVSSCLGADCTVGVWLMRRMYMARVPGRYIWHADEESGGQGSRYIASKTPALLTGIQAAIAFDRKGDNSIITHQAGGRCASDDFAASLVPMLPGTYKADAGGTFTDTANYTDLVPECTNLSVGYQHAHTARECTNLGHAERLLKAMLLFDETKLVIKRKPGEDDAKHYVRGWVQPVAGSKASRRRAARQGGNPYGGYGPFDDWFGRDPWRLSRPSGGARNTPAGQKSAEPPKRTAAAFIADSSGSLTRLDTSPPPAPILEHPELSELSFLEARIKANPRRAAELLLELGIDYDTVLKWW